MGGGASMSNNKCWICDVLYALYVPKYHQKLGCQANVGSVMLFMLFMSQISSKTRMPKNHLPKSTKILSKTRMPVKCWICDALYVLYVPKYHQKLGCQANGGARAGHAPLDLPMKPRMPGKWGGGARAGRAPPP